MYLDVEIVDLKFEWHFPDGRYEGQRLFDVGGVTDMLKPGSQILNL